ncbi:hypothetical protein [Massilimicrobiota sp. An134]|uniref:hypothetical protein n=1 Tax=Massilimicrobiota sp. An134 TaxID=1965557 RepID=UPI001F14EBCC|nr:hypothetical protein [Massilimicrobiota sp. An134]
MKQRKNDIYPIFYKAEEVTKILDVSKPTAYKIIQSLNQRIKMKDTSRLQEESIRIISGNACMLENSIVEL